MNFQSLYNNDTILILMVLMLCWSAASDEIFENIDIRILTKLN